MGKFTDLLKEMFNIKVEIKDERSKYSKKNEHEKADYKLLTSKENRRGKYYLLRNQIMIYNILRDEPELMDSIYKIALEDGFLIDNLYAKIELVGNKAKMVIAHNFDKLVNENRDNFEHILVIKEDVDEPEEIKKVVTDSIRGRVTRIIQKVISSYSEKPSKNLEFLSYRVKKLIEDRKSFYRSVGETDRTLFLSVADGSKELNEHEEVLSSLLNFRQ